MASKSELHATIIPGDDARRHERSTRRGRDHTVRVALHAVVPVDSYDQGVGRFFFDSERSLRDGMDLTFVPCES